MLGKRTRIVDYSSSSSNSPDKAGDRVQKKKKIISYSNLPISNPVKELTQYLENEEKFKELKSELKENESTFNKKYSTIKVNSVRGDIQLNLPEATFTSKSRRRSKKPFYYNVMEEIYQDEIEKEKAKGEEAKKSENGVPGNGASMDQSEISMVNGTRRKGIEGSNINFREVDQREQVQFNQAEYLARKQKRDQLLNMRANLNPTNTELKKNQLNAMAFKQLENEALKQI